MVSVLAVTGLFHRPVPSNLPQGSKKNRFMYVPETYDSPMPFDCAPSQDVSMWNRLFFLGYVTINHLKTLGHESCSVLGKNQALFWLKALYQGNEVSWQWFPFIPVSPTHKWVGPLLTLDIDNWAVEATRRHDVCLKLLFFHVESLLHSWRRSLTLRLVSIDIVMTMYLSSQFNTNSELHLKIAQ